MAISHVERFLLEATAPDECESPLGPDCLYGLYTSWCMLHRITPVDDIGFRSAMRRCGVNVDNCRRRMVGATAVDYLLATYPADA